MKWLSKRGQSTGEYAILFAIVLGAVFAVQNFVRHNIAGTLKDSADTYISTSGLTPAIVQVNTSANTAQRSHSDFESAGLGSVDSQSNTMSVSESIP